MTAGAARRPGRQSAEAASRTRRTVLDAALRLFAARGYEGVSLRDIADAAGTTHGLIRHHFGAKPDVWRAVADEADARYVAALPPGLLDPAGDEPARSAREALADLLAGLLVAAWRHPEIARLLLHEGSLGGDRLTYVLRHVEPLRRICEPLLDRLHAEGRLTRVTAEGFLLLLVGASTAPLAFAPLAAAVSGADLAREDDVRRLAELMTALLVGD